MSTYHVKVYSGRTFNPVTRKTPFVCRSGNPATQGYIVVTEGDGETLEETRARLKRLDPDPNAALCEGCAEGLEGRESMKRRDEDDTYNAPSDENK